MPAEGRTIIYPGTGEPPPEYSSPRRGSRSSNPEGTDPRLDGRRHSRSRDIPRAGSGGRTRDPRERPRRHSDSRTPVVVQPTASRRPVPYRPDDGGEEDERYVVPALPLPLAILCCVLNFIVPGLGSMTAALCVFCCANTEDMTCGEKCCSCLTVFGIGLLQLLLIVCFLIGWIWSCIWGITFIGMSLNYYREDYVQSRIPPWERNLRGRTPLPTPEVVPHQPYPGIGYEDLQREQERRRRSRERRRRSRSRISLSSSNLIYPMRAPSNIAYNSPPPPYDRQISPSEYRSRTDTRAGDGRQGTAATSTLHTLQEAPMEQGAPSSSQGEVKPMSPTVPINNQTLGGASSPQNRISLSNVPVSLEHV